MKYFVGITDKEWFDQLQEMRPDELNFWKPGGTQAFRALAPGEPFLFKLHGPHNFIVGGGFFVGFSFLPVSLAWDAFERKNGVRDRVEFLQRIIHYRREPPIPLTDPTIGCVILTSPFFLSRDEWVPVPADWPRSTVQGKTYSTEESVGASLWKEVRARIEGIPGAYVPPSTVLEIRPTYDVLGRVGQGAFRVLVTDAYERRCAITGERTLPVLEAGHIVPYSVEQSNLVSNGLLLRADLHKLFDQGLLTVTPELRVKVSPAIRERFENGRDYYALQDQPLKITPTAKPCRPDLDRLSWHNENIFVG